MAPLQIVDVMRTSQDPQWRAVVWDLKSLGRISGQLAAHWPIGHESKAG